MNVNENYRLEYSKRLLNNSTKPSHLKVWWQGCGLALRHATWAGSTYLISWEWSTHKHLHLAPLSLAQLVWLLRREALNTCQFCSASLFLLKHSAQNHPRHYPQLCWNLPNNANILKMCHNHSKYTLRPIHWKALQLVLLSLTSNKLLTLIVKMSSAGNKVIIEKSRGEVSPIGQDTIENVS